MLQSRSSGKASSISQVTFETFKQKQSLNHTQKLVLHHKHTGAMHKICQRSSDTNKKTRWYKYTRTYTARHIWLSLTPIQCLCCEKTHTEASTVMNTDIDISVCKCVLSIWCEVALQTLAGIWGTQFLQSHVLLVPLTHTHTQTHKHTQTNTHTHRSFDFNRRHQLFSFLFNVTD